MIEVINDHRLKLTKNRGPRSKFAKRGWSRLILLAIERSPQTNATEISINKIKSNRYGIWVRFSPLRLLRNTGVAGHSIESAELWRPNRRLNHAKIGSIS